ncbi:MAG: hypothetical protein M1121_03810 [Actinobacteria bacterium]|nr:hypothetical protein [Actinomycetota bacterium]
MAALIFVLIPLALIVILVVSIFVSRHRENPSPELGWQPTAEVFNDPSTNRVMRVWLDPIGQRHYVAEGERPAI